MSKTHLLCWWYSLALLVERKQQPQNPNIETEIRNKFKYQTTECSKPIFSTDPVAYYCFGHWNLWILIIVSNLVLRISDLSMPLWGCNCWNWHSGCKTTGLTGGFFTW
jgi:hypothetical protein